MDLEKVNYAMYHGGGKKTKQLYKHKAATVKHTENYGGYLEFKQRILR